MVSVTDFISLLTKYLCLFIVMWSEEICVARKEMWVAIEEVVLWGHCRGEGWGSGGQLV